LLFSLVVHLRGLDVFLTADELKWTCRTINFRTALLRGDLAHTFQVGHPGVITMWAGSLGLPLDLNGDWSDICQETHISRLSVAIGHDRLVELGRLAFQARRPVALLTWLSTVAIVLLTARLFGRIAGLMAAILVSLDPFYLALSRVLHLDALTGSFMVVSLIALLVAKVESWKVKGWNVERSNLQPSTVYLLVSGFFAGLAFLNKSPALFLGPVAVVVVAWAMRPERQKAEGSQSSLPAAYCFLPAVAIWVAAAGVTTVALWPALWVNPVGTVLAVLDKALGYAAEGHDNLNYFLGQISNDPGLTFYPIAWAFRTTPLVWLGLLGIAGFALRLNPKGYRLQVRKLNVGTLNVPTFNLLTLVTFGLLFAAFMTVGAKKFDRYIVPTFLALDVAAAVGLARIAEQVASYRLQVTGYRLKVTGLGGQGSELATLRAEPQGEACNLQLATYVVLVVAVQAALVLPYGPYLLSYFNPLLGGGAVAQQVMLVGWGEGLDQAAAYLNARPGSRNLHVGTRYISDFGPLFVGFSDSTDDYNPALTDYFVFYVNQVQRRLSPDVLDRHHGVEQPEHVVRMFGIDYAWIYANVDHKPVADYLAQHADPARDAVLLNGPSHFQQAYSGPLPVHVVEGEWDETRIVAGLQEAARGRRRLWYLTYPRADNDPERLIQHQLDTHAWRGENQDFPTSNLTAYDLPDPPTFRVPAADRPADLRFGTITEEPSLQLRGFGLDPAPAQFGRGLSIALDWQALQPPGEDLSAFIYLVDQAGHRWGQGDKQIMVAGRPTSRWQAGETHLDRYALTVLPGTPPGRYQVRFGVYRTTDNRRLAFTGPAGATGTEWLLGTVEVAPSPVVPSLEEMGIGRLAPFPSLPLAGGGSEGGGSSVRLIGADVPDEVRTGETLPVTLFWEVLAPVGRDYRLRLSLVAADARPLADATLPPASEYPTSRWRPGERLRSQLDLPIPADAPGGPARLRIQFVDAAGQPAGPPMDVAQVNVTAVERRFSLPPDVQHRLDVRLGDRITLAGYDLALDPDCTAQDASTPAACVVHLTLYWQALGRPDRDYTVFVHLLDSSGQIRSQVDRPPVDGSRPTSGWIYGEVLMDRYDLLLPPNTPAGQYRVVVGMYDLTTLQRLPAVGADGQRLPDDRIVVGELEVRR
jgi:4-amino-4-deoxy-L-arabinose transferase-like glycosyltransferase